VLDEPMSALDEAGIQVFERLLHGWRQAGTTVLWIEHDLQAAAPGRPGHRAEPPVLFDAPPAEALTPERLLSLFSVHPRSEPFMSFEAFRQWSRAGPAPVTCRRRWPTVSWSTRCWRA
jgi:zinc transport system ATP-binding protein